MMSAQAVHRMIQISDTHLRSGDTDTLPGWRAALDYIAAAAPDCVIHTGDIVRNEPEATDDHAFATAELRTLNVPWVAVPGNHDVGDGPPDALSPRPELLDAFRSNYGEDRWERNLGPWRLIGVNSLLFGSNLPDETEQWNWLQRLLAPKSRSGSVLLSPIAIFMHKPPFLIDPHEDGATSATIPARSRRRCWDLFLRSDAVRLVACGHRHEYRTLAVDGVKVVWAPTTASGPLLDERTPPLAAQAHPGIVEYAFCGRTVMHRLVPLSVSPEMSSVA